MMAVEIFVYILIVAFALSTFIAIALLVSAARRITESERKSETAVRQHSANDQDLKML